MAAASPSVLIVDDADSRILYTPATSWTTAGNPLLEFRGTTHVLGTGSGSANFKFNGTRIEVYGTVAPGVASNPITCTVDGNTIEVASTVTAPLTSPLYHQLFCSGTVADNQEHTLVVTANASPTQTFFLDYLLYSYPQQTNNSAAPGGATPNIVVDDRQANQVSFSNGWTLGGAPPELDGTTHGTSTVNSTATFTFTGTNVEAYGTVAADLIKTWVTTYSIDGSTNTSLDSSVFKTTTDLHNVRFFASANLPDTAHTLTITYASGELPYWLDYFIFTPSSTFGVVQPPPPPQTTTSSSTTTTSTTTTTGPPGTLPSSPTTSGSTNTPNVQQQTANNSSTPTGTIIGATVGALVGLLALLLVVVIFLRRRKGRSRDSIVFPYGTERVNLNEPADSPYPVYNREQSYGSYGNQDPSPTGAYSQPMYSRQQPTYGQQPMYGQQTMYGQQQQQQMYGNHQPVTYAQGTMPDHAPARPVSQHSLGYLRNSGDVSQSWPGTDGSNAPSSDSVTSASHLNPPNTGAGPPPPAYKN